MSFEQAQARALARLELARDRGEVDARVEPLLALLNGLPDHFTTSSCAGRVQLIGVAAPGDKLSAHRWGIWHDPPELALLEVALADWRKARRQKKALAGSETTLLYLQAQSPILHVACRDLTSAHRLRSLAVNNGWKYSSLRGVRGADPLGPLENLQEVDTEGIHQPHRRKCKVMVAAASTERSERLRKRPASLAAASTERGEGVRRRPLPRTSKVMVELLCSERMDCALARGDRLYVEGEALAFQLEVANLTLRQAQARLGRLEEGLRANQAEEA